MSDDVNDFFGRPDNAPNGPDFWALSDVVLKHDGRIEDAEESEIPDVYEGILAEAGVTHEALHYMAQQRTYRLLGLVTQEDVDGKDPRLLGALAAMFVDGFIVGSGFERERDDTE